MPDTEYRRLIQAAKEKAQIGFLAVVQRAIQDADKTVVDRLVQAKSGLDLSALTALRHFLRQEGNVFLRCIDGLYRNYLDRAMQTMYTDLRQDMRKLSVDELSLIDDEAVNLQIEVGRLAQRMRESNEESIGRLNVIVANLHGQTEARERENPFRPYLLARALFESIRETAADGAKEKLLFEYLSNALIPHLPGFYASLRDVFEASGVRGKFIAQRSRAAYSQRHFGAPMGDMPVGVPASDRVMKGLTRVLETLQQSGAGAGIGSGGHSGAGSAVDAGRDGQPISVQDFLRSMFSANRGASLPLPAANPLAMQVHEFQQKAARGEAVDPAVPAGKNQLAALRERLNLDDASVAERMTVEAVSLLFDFIVDDEQIPAPLREHIGRLQIPMLKAALLEPQLMHDERHPARRLLNRMSSAAVGTDPDSAGGQRLDAEMDRVTRKVLTEFESKVAVFSESLSEFERFLGSSLREDDNATAQAIEAVESAEKYSVLLTNTTRALCDVLLPLNIDKKISDFIITVWPHVLVRAAWEDEKQAGNLFEQYHAVLPELVWSIQEKGGPPERSALMRLLPDLVRRLRAALNLIQLPDDESKPMLDMLVSIHTQILRGSPKSGGGKQPTLEELRQEFARVAIRWARASWGLSEPPQARESIIEEVFGRAGATVDLNINVGTAATAADREFLSQSYLLGTRVEIHTDDGKNQVAQLVWISTHRSLYLFRRAEGGSLTLFTPAALLEALSAQTIVPLEYAPVFERAVESLLFGAGNIDAAA